MAKSMAASLTDAVRRGYDAARRCDGYGSHAYCESRNHTAPALEALYNRVVCYRVGVGEMEFLTGGAPPPTSTSTRTGRWLSTPLLDRIALPQLLLYESACLSKNVTENSRCQRRREVGPLGRRDRYHLPDDRRREPPPLLTATGAAGRATQLPMPWQRLWSAWLVPGMTVPTTPIPVSCSANARALTSAGPPCGASYP